MAIGIEPPDHVLGVLMHVKFSYCGACTAGLMKCIHCAKTLWVQFHHWGPGRPVERPPTMDLCCWFHKGTAQPTDVRTPVENMACAKLPRSLQEADNHKL